MDNDPGHRRSHLFILRMWAEPVSEGQAEWRGRLQHVTSGETHYFRDWSMLVALLLEMLPKLNDDDAQLEVDEPSC